MMVRHVILGLVLAGCTRAADPAPTTTYRLDKLDSSTSFPVDTQALAAQIAANEHQDILK